MYTKTIRFDRETRDFEMKLDGRLIGYARTHHDAERKLDALVAEKIAHYDYSEQTDDGEADDAALPVSAFESALRVRDRLQRAEFEAQVADEPPVPTPSTRIEYDHNADLFVAYVDGAEVTAAPTQAECNAALDRVTLGAVSVPSETYARWQRVLSENQIDEMLRAALADAVESIDDHVRATADALKRNAARERAAKVELAAFTEAFGG